MLILGTSSMTCDVKCVTTALLRSFVVALLMVNCDCKRRCNYRDILDAYKGIIAVELNTLNITAPYNNSKERNICPSVKAYNILSTIYKTTRRMLCQIGGKQSDLNKPLESMEQVILHNCSPAYMEEKFSCVKIKRKKKRRMRLIRMIRALKICWQKLLSTFSMQ